MAGGGKGSDNSGKKMLQWEKQQVKAAEKKEAERQARLATGKTNIDGKFAAIGDPFYKTYQDNYLNYYMPQVQDQYKNAKDDLNFGYGRAGTLKSSMAAKGTADLYKRKLDQDAMVRSQGDAATGQLRSSVLDAKNSAISQLYATEDPTLATNLATNSIKNLTGQQPKYDPLGELFNTAAVGAAGFINANSQRASSSGGSYLGSPGSRSKTTSVG
jgi:hypothetical protein